MSNRSLEDLLASADSPVELLRNSQAGPNVYPGVPAEFTNWRDEQTAWQQTCVLFNQSYHMADLAVEGPDATALLSSLAVNSFDGFTVDRAKHFVPCTPDGYVIGDVILFFLAENRYNLVGRAPALNWVTYHAETGGYDVRVELDQRSALRTDGRRRSYRFQVQGPNAMAVIEKLLGGPAPELRFFHMTTITIAGKTVRALRHGMAGQPGWELFGPWDDGEAVREAIVGAGEEFGLRQVGGGRTPPTRSSPAGSPRRSRRCTRATASRPIASGCRRRATKAPRRSAAASSPTASSTTTSRPGTWGTGSTSSSTTTSSAGRRSSGSRTTSIAARSRWLWTTTTSLPRSGRCSGGGTARSSSTGPPRSTRCTPTTGSRSTARRSGSRPGSATAPTRARC